ncbi:hypothetical protein EC973_007569 [Apophysomyces ossiformis]|uniref:RhoGAP-domain-containing protein n=1 Tax=Apophysomyces ossiformis TaxID=679940 RepID=A0A8H7BPI5_9FUNG|nr:hypothetical protein EC973_007569 [Apophysomyces ossiformis]
MDAYYDGDTIVGEEYEDPRCGGCHELIEDGSVLQFGDGIWHFECFRCAKCRKLIEHYNSHLLLGDGRPVCEACSCQCRACKNPIQDEAIMTGEDTYHADCFRCIQCGVKITNLIFTQTSKGIYCIPCFEARKQLRQKRKEERMQQQTLSSGDVFGESVGQSPTISVKSISDSLNQKPGIFGLTRSSSLEANRRGNSTRQTRLPREPSNASILDSYAEHGATPRSNGSVLSPKELAELNQMLNSALEPGLCDDLSTSQYIDSIPSPPQTYEATSPKSNPLERYTLNAEKTEIELPRPSSSNESIELERTKARLKEVETKFNKIKDISRKALDEFHVVKEGFCVEVAARREAENTVAKLKRELSLYQQAGVMGTTEFSTYAKTEIAQLTQTVAQLEKTCNDLRTKRDDLMNEIHDVTKDYREMAESHKSSDAVYEKLLEVYHQELASVRLDIDTVKTSYTKLVKTRDEIITEMIMLNTKNAELTSLNNDLSRRVTEREREAVAVMAATRFLSDDEDGKVGSNNGNDSIASPLSPEPPGSARRITLKDAFAGTEAPRSFKFRRNRSRSGSKSKKNNTTSKEDNGLISIPYDSSRPADAAASSQDSPCINRVGGHNFIQTKILRPLKCEACGEKMWRANELKCQGKKSREGKGESDPPTKGAWVKIQPKQAVNTPLAIFGNELAKQVQSENGTIPLVVEKCIDAVEARGMSYEGIYRKSGGAGQMRLIMQAFEQGETPNLRDQEQWNDICAITSVLKHYLRDLPDPLFTYDKHPKFIEAILISNPAEQIRVFGELIHSLPTENFDTLKYLMTHLDKVQQQCKDNLMTAKNLAVIFGPTLMRQRDNNMDLVEMNHKIGVIEFILNHMSSLFCKNDQEPEQEQQPQQPLTPKPSTSSGSSLMKHRREASCDDIRHIPPAVPPRENAGYI